MSKGKTEGTLHEMAFAQHQAWYIAAQQFSSLSVHD